jgi:hypothetical protein
VKCIYAVAVDYMSTMDAYSYPALLERTCSVDAGRVACSMTTIDRTLFHATVEVAGSELAARVEHCAHAVQDGSLEL